jgi:hypothetical protein
MDTGSLTQTMMLTTHQFSLKFMKTVILLGNFALGHEYFILTRFYMNQCGSHRALQWLVRGAFKKFWEMWYSTEMVGHMTTLT